MKFSVPRRINRIREQHTPYVHPFARCRRQIDYRRGLHPTRRKVDGPNNTTQVLGKDESREELRKRKKI